LRAVVGSTRGCRQRHPYDFIFGKRFHPTLTTRGCPTFKSICKSLNEEIPIYRSLERRFKNAHAQTRGRRPVICKGNQPILHAENIFRSCLLVSISSAITLSLELPSRSRPDVSVNAEAEKADRAGLPRPFRRKMRCDDEGRAGGISPVASGGKQPQGALRAPSGGEIFKPVRPRSGMPGLAGDEAKDSLPTQDSPFKRRREVVQTMGFGPPPAGPRQPGMQWTFVRSTRRPAAAFTFATFETVQPRRK